jgi:hypothetical protein
MPAVQQTGLGDFCEPVVPIPASWAGQTGILGVVQDAPDGILYQVSPKSLQRYPSREKSRIAQT